jgi:dephospho-CoA kinase
MRIIGLTGGIGSGKSTVSAIFIQHDIPVVDADILARQVVAPHSLGLVEVIDAFGLRFLQADGTLNRPALGALVFARSDAMLQLNAIMLPLIQQEAIQQFAALEQAGHDWACYDAATLIENGQADKYRPLIVVHCAYERQIERLTWRGLTHEEAVVRIESQLPTTAKLEYADYTINTNGSKEWSEQQTVEIIGKLRNQ